MNEPGRKVVVVRKTPQQTSREQKAGFALVSITGALAVFLGLFFMARHVTHPFDSSYVGPRFLTAAERQQEELSSQRVSDTDQDGLTDYDELYIHRTSPYLSDTDSDGKTDGVEIASGTDPNCATGDACDDPTIQDAVQSSGIDAIGTTFEPTTDVEQPSADPFSELDNVTPQAIRELLIQTGADPEEVSLLTDAELLEVYQKALQEVEQEQQTGTQTESTSSL